MSGTSGDGVDASIIESNGKDQFQVIKDKYFEYDSSTYKEIHDLKDKIFNASDLKKFSKDLTNLQRKITLYHAMIIKELQLKSDDILLGFMVKQFTTTQKKNFFTIR